jgi:hypothetical protein
MATAGIEHPTWCSRKVSRLTPTAVFALTTLKSPIVSRPVNTGVTLYSTDHAAQHTQVAHSLAPLSLDLARPIAASLTPSRTASMRPRSSGRFGLWSRVRGYAKPPALQSTARESPSVHKWCVLHWSNQRPTSRRRQHPFACHYTTVIAIQLARAGRETRTHMADDTCCNTLATNMSMTPSHCPCKLDWYPESQHLASPTSPASS